MLFCIDPKTYNLTIRRRYTQEGEKEDKIAVRNDINKKAYYSSELFRNYSVVPLVLEDVSKIDIGRTNLLHIHTGRMVIATAEMLQSDYLNSCVFAHKLGLCPKDEKIPRKLIIDLVKIRGKGVIFKSKPYILMELNGKDKVVLLGRDNRRPIRVLKTEILNNENCYEG